MISLRGIFWFSWLNPSVSSIFSNILDRFPPQKPSLSISVLRFLFPLSFSSILNVKYLLLKYCFFLAEIILDVLVDFIVDVKIFLRMVHSADFLVDARVDRTIFFFKSFHFLLQLHYGLLVVPQLFLQTKLAGLTLSFTHATASFVLSVLRRKCLSISNILICSLAFYIPRPSLKRK